MLRPGSPVRNDGRGLKQAAQPLSHRLQAGSPVRNDGRGLKHRSQQLLIGPDGLARQK